MKVTILKPAGYCAGVARAIKLAKNTKIKNPKKNVVILGMLVHNEDALKTLQKYGILTICGENKTLSQMINDIKKPSIVILTAHGHDKKIEKLLKEKGHQVVDATCPFVSKSFTKINEAINNKEIVYYIGAKNHPESDAALSLSKNIKFIDINDPKIPSSKKEVFVISQTTLSKTEVDEIKKKIKTRNSKVVFEDGICNSSTLRQEALKKIPKNVDAVLIVGGKKSNNSKTLFKIAKELYPNKIVKLIENCSELKEKDLKGLNHIAISSGASTPNEVIEQIKARLTN